MKYWNRHTSIYCVSVNIIRIMSHMDALRMVSGPCSSLKSSGLVPTLLPYNKALASKVSMRPIERHWRKIEVENRVIVCSSSYDGGSRNDRVVAVRRGRQPVPGSYDAPPARGGGGPPGGLPPDDDENGESGDGNLKSNLTRAFVAGSFILGMGAGIWFDSEVTFAPQNVASTVLVDTKTPNSEVCMANGYSSMVFDQRIFVSFNPFNVYVSQPEVKPGCVLRRANVNVLESRGLVDQQEVQNCKRNMNTFAFVGDLTGNPQVSCVYHSEEAENQFLRNPEKSIVTGEVKETAGEFSSRSGQ